MKPSKAVKQARRTAWNSTLPAPSKPMKRSPLERRTRLKAKGGSRFPKRRCPPFLNWLKTLPCFVTGQRTGGAWPLPYNQGFTRIVVDPAHLVKSRGAGADDLGFVLPLAHHLHDEAHQIGIKSWLRKHGLTEEGVSALAGVYADEWRALFPEIAAKYDAPTPGAPPSPTEGDNT